MNVSNEEKELKKIIGEQLGKARNKLGISQENLAKSINMDRANYTKIENGNTERRLQLSQLVKLAEVLNSSMDYIFGLTKESTTDISAKEIYKEYGLTEESLTWIKRAKIYSEDSLNYFLENIGLLGFIIKINKYNEISNMLDNMDFIKFLSATREYIIEKLKKNKKQDLETFINYCRQCNQYVQEVALVNEIDYSITHQKYKDLDDLLSKKEITTDNQSQEKIIQLIDDLYDDYVKLSVKLCKELKIIKLEIIESIEYLLDEIKFSNQILIGSKEFSNLFKNDDKELKKYLGDTYLQNKKHFENPFIPYL